MNSNHLASALALALDLDPGPLARTLRRAGISNLREFVEELAEYLGEEEIFPEEELDEDEVFFD